MVDKTLTQYQLKLNNRFGRLIDQSNETMALITPVSGRSQLSK